MDGKNSKVAPVLKPTLVPKMRQRRGSLIEEYYAWRDIEIHQAAIIEAHKTRTPPPSPTYEKRYRQIDDMHTSYRKKDQKRKDLMDDIGGEMALDIFKPNKEKKFAMYPIVAQSPDETPCLSPNLSFTSLGSSNHHHSSFPHLPETNADSDTDRPTQMKFKLPDDEEPDLKKTLLQSPQERARKISGSRRPTQKELDRDLEKNEILDGKLTKWELIQIFMPWVLVVVSILQIWLFSLDNDEIFRLMVFSPKRLPEIWRFFTYIFLHNNFTHLVLNVVIQVILAVPLEFEQSHFKVFGIYFGGGIVGAMGASVFEHNQLMVGSSAGVYSLLMSHITHTVLNKRIIKYPWYRVAVVLFLCASDIIYFVYHYNTNGNLEPKIGVSAHIFGGLGGLLLGMVLYSFIAPEDKHQENQPKYYKVCRRASIVLLAIIVLVTVIYNLIVSS